MNGKQGTKPAGRQRNCLLEAVVTIMKYKKIKIYHAIYIKVFSDQTGSYLIVSPNDVLNNKNNKTGFTEISKCIEKSFLIQIQEGCALKYL